MPTAKDICERQLMKVIDDLEKVKVNEEEIADFMPDVYRKLDWLSKEDLIKRMVSHEFNRFSDYYRDRADITVANDPRAERKEKNGKKGASGEDNRRAEPGYTRFFINLGKNDNLFPNELIGLINSHVRGRVEIGRIDLMRNFSFFEVEEGATQNVLKGLSRANWKGHKVTVEIAGDEPGSTPKKPKKNARKPADPTSKRRKKPAAEEAEFGRQRGKQDDWKQFFQHNDDPRWQEPNFDEEGWAKPSKKKAKKN